MKKLVLIISATLMLSCGTGKVVRNAKKLEPSKYENLGYKLNNEYDTDIGHNLINNVHGRYYDAIKVTKEAKSNKYYFNKTIKEGVYVKKMETNDYYIYMPKDTDITMNIGIRKSDKVPVILYSNGYSSYSVMDFIQPLQYEATTHEEVSEDYFKQEFVYNGKSGNSIKFMYREYKNDYARPAFTQDLQYDLSESNVIGFKDLRIEVIKASNTSIKYKILNGF